MKLSELFRTPFKLKGGSTLNLKGFSKRVIDKEVGEGGGGSSEDSKIANFINTFFSLAQDYPKPASFEKFYDDSSGNIISVENIRYGRVIRFLYNNSIELGVSPIIIGFNIIPSDKSIEVIYKDPNLLTGTDITIDGITYRYFEEGMA